MGSVDVRRVDVRNVVMRSTTVRTVTVRAWLEKRDHKECICEEHGYEVYGSDECGYE